MALNTWTVYGASPDFATLAAFESGRDNESSGGDEERALVRAGVHSESVTFSGWGNNKTVSIYPDTGAEHDGTPGSGVAFTASTSYTLVFDNTPQQLTVELNGIEVRQTGGGGTAAIQLNRPGQYAFRKCLLKGTGGDVFFINGPQVSQGASTVTFEACALYGASAQTINYVHFGNINTAVDIVCRNCISQDAVVRMRVNAGTATLNFTAYNSIFQAIRESGDLTHVVWTMVDCANEEASWGATVDSDTDSIHSATVVTGTPGTGQIGVTSVTTPDYHLVDHANNVAIDAGDGANAPSFGTDWEGDTCATTGTENVDLGPDQIAAAGAALVAIINDALNNAETIEQHRAIRQIVNETLNNAETLIRARTLARIVDETLNNTETIIRARALVRVLDEALNVAETNPHLLALVRVLDEALDNTETNIASISTSIVQVIDEALNVAETNPHLLALVRVLDETLNNAETIVRSRALVRVLDEALDNTETNPHLLALVRVLDEALDNTETNIASISTSIVQVIDEALNVTETNPHLLALVRVLDESLQAGETLVAARTMVRILDEALDLTEGTLAARILVRIADESLDLTETVVDALAAAGAALVRVVDEGLDLTETAVDALANALTLIVDEGLDLTETMAEFLAAGIPPSLPPLVPPSVDDLAIVSTVLPDVGEEVVPVPRMERFPITDTSWQPRVVEEVFRTFEDYVQPGVGPMSGLIHLTKMTGGSMIRSTIGVSEDRRLRHALQRVPTAILLSIDLRGTGGQVQGTPTNGPNIGDWTTDTIYVRASVASDYLFILV